MNSSFITSRPGLCCLFNISVNWSPIKKWLDYFQITCRYRSSWRINSITNVYVFIEIEMCIMNQDKFDIKLNNHYLLSWVNVLLQSISPKHLAVTK